MIGKWNSSTLTSLNKQLRMLVILGMLFGMLAPLLQPRVAEAAQVSSVVLSGGTGTYQASPDSTLYAKNGGELILTVTTDATTKCVKVTDGTTTLEKTSASAQTHWTFNSTDSTTLFKAGAGNTNMTLTATAWKQYTGGTGQGQNTPKCVAEQGETIGSVTVSYVLDNAGPVVTAALAPAANGAGWNKSNVGITWSATDSGSGVATGPTPALDSVIADTAGLTKSASATDRLGNTGTGSVTVKLDKTFPTIAGSRSPAANGNGWNNTDVTVSFTCADPKAANDSDGSGIKSCTADGTDPAAASKTLTGNGANQAVHGTAVDNADNSVSATVGNISIDKVAPTLSGAPTTSPNGAGWYNTDVMIAWSANDNLSGIVAAPANSTISSEGTGLTASASVSDLAGNSSGVVSSSPAVKIDKTAPNTTATAPTNWNNVNVTISLSANDALSGVAATRYSLNGAPEQTGTSVSISSEGVHTLSFYSVDVAGNSETAKTVQVKIDKTPPTINHTQSPAANDNGWNNTNVTVTFTCADVNGSGIASCTAPQTVTTEGLNQTVTGTATDNAGNTATDPARVSIDKTAPTISAAADRSPNTNLAANGKGWYNADVVVSFTCGDALSGVASCPTAQTLGEGANQTASGTAVDAAGNTATNGVSGINVDKTAPTLTGTPSTTGWSTGDVTVTWACSDALSGIDGSCPGASTVTGEGNNLSTSASVSDKAGNSKSTTVAGIKIDRTAPSTSVSTDRAPLASGWYAGAVQVTLSTGADLSGIAATYYSVDGGAAQVYSSPFSHSLTGQHTITFWSVDNAGHTEDNTTPGHSITLKIDDVKPTTRATVTPEAYTSGWHAGAVTVGLVGSDGESGVSATYYRLNSGAQQSGNSVEITAKGIHTLEFWSVDNVGNVEAVKSVEVKIDNVLPSITGSRTPQANGHGWDKTSVTVAFSCSDAETAIASCTPETLLENEGAGQSTSGTAIDMAGNQKTATVANINIDKTAPTLTGAATTNPNTFLWYKGDVTIEWTGQDALSSIDPATQPANSTITGEGSNRGAGPVSISDKAGNSASASVSGIKIDRTAPSISGATVNADGSARSANADGWFNSAVRVRFSCSDALSGVQECASDAVLSSDGTGLSANGTATDKADNSASATVSGIKIDSQAPTSEADLSCTGQNGYCRGAKATIELSAADQTGLSGVKEIRYSEDNGATWVTITGASGSFDITLNRSGKTSVLYKAFDYAGNEETANKIEVKYDTVAPSITHSVSQRNAAGWSNVDATVTFTAEDDSDGSGVASLTIDGVVAASQTTAASKTLSGSKSVTTETSGQTLNAAGEDFAGNVGTDSELVKLDKTKPTISGAATTQPNANGWYNGSVTVKFTCADARSGIATCPADEVKSTDGANQSASGTAIDMAGNTDSATVGGINIDSVKPTIDSVSVANGATYILAAVPAATCQATDSGSGLAGACSVTLDSSKANANGTGTFSFTATATDKAGNTQTVTGSYTVIYNIQYGVAFFLQPINDTAHTTGLTTSIFKAGSTVPVKFQLKDANGNIVQASSAPLWLTPAKGSATSEAVSESAYSDPATTGTTYRWDGQQYIYNWGSPKNGAGYYWRVGVKLDDGRMYAVNIGLR